MGAMTAIRTPRGRTAEHAAAPAPRVVVATVLRHGDSTALLRRSALVGSDRGLWHCVTGFVEPGWNPTAQARLELSEEAGLDDAATGRLVAGRTLALADHTGHGWQVHTFRLEVATRDVRLNWEHDAVRWIADDEPHDLPCVSWLDQVLTATLPTRRSALTRKARA